VRKKTARRWRDGVTKRKVARSPGAVRRKSALGAESHFPSRQSNTFGQVAQASIDKNREVLLELAKY
jgi:hypothetical protein